MCILYTEHLEYMYSNNVSMVTSVAVYIKFYNLSTTSCVHFVIPHHHSAAPQFQAFVPSKCGSNV